ncbi:MAG: DUF2085 domain-containing protein [Acidobacteria bacterium]|nr:DUF2085 domain-containing protein [Acidobacteriota bacterium]
MAIVSRVPILSRAAACVYAAGGFVCHQRPERSFHLHGRPLAVCARCAGLYASALAGGIVALLVGVPLVSARRARLWLALAAVPTVVTVGIELAGVAHPSNTMRMISALPLGAIAAWLVVGELSRPPEAG